jgi:hypothetical protein
VSAVHRDSSSPDGYTDAILVETPRDATDTHNYRVCFQESKVVYKEKIATDLARHLFAHAQSIVRWFPGAKRDTFVMDGNSLTVSLCFAGDKAEIRIDGIASAADAGPEAGALIRLLHDMVPERPRFR